MIRILLSILGVAGFFNTHAQDKSQFAKRWFIQNGDTMPYRVLLPAGYDSSKRYPLILFLHGRGESGRDNESQLANGAALFLRDTVRKRYPAIVVFPQCPANNYWSNVIAETAGTLNSKRNFYFTVNGDPTDAMRTLMSLTDHLLNRFNVNRQQVYVGGLSMGGMGVYELVRRKPQIFAAAFAICGGAHPATAKELRKTRWWLFHGLKDDIVDPQFTKNMEVALEKAGAGVKATYYTNANHNSWDSAFEEPGLLQWLFTQKRW
ncbi:phospholipase [Segetibacter sp. 3557_3]|uniref:carboxylesterase family protein n=1 Tax=Segetibacter sp. 3557_3 TaxID=2547429 RepID=UPI00105901BA|nr:alpha/beta hydrolase-fold protein [Segetibacter sp. 3557_3]TDH23060.1 phospholipase [Segetibacter sp. 3557_3]